MASPVNRAKGDDSPPNPAMNRWAREKAGLPTCIEVLVGQFGLQFLQLRFLLALRLRSPDYFCKRSVMAWEYWRDLSSTAPPSISAPRRIRARRLRGGQVVDRRGRACIAIRDRQVFLQSRVPAASRLRRLCPV